LVLGNDLPLSWMSTLNEAPEDIVNEQDHRLRPKRSSNISLPYSPYLSSHVNNRSIE
jgi:hypothetical protein